MEHPSCAIHKHDSHESCVAAVPIFNHLEPEQMAEVMQMVRTKTVQRGEFLYYSGDESDALYIVNHGGVKIYHLTETGHEQLIRFLHPGDFTGELALFNVTVSEGYAEAIADTEICMMKRDDVQKLLMKYPAISLKILTEFASRLADSEKKSASFATEKAERRIAAYLAEHSKGDHYFQLPMSKKDTASYLGTTPETLSRRMKEFEEQGIINQKGQRMVQVLDIDRLLQV